MERNFGAGFATAIESLPVGVWQGPVRSEFGLHLVEVTARVPGRKATLEEARAAVERDLLHARTRGSERGVLPAAARQLPRAHRKRRRRRCRCRRMKWLAALLLLLLAHGRRRRIFSVPPISNCAKPARTRPAIPPTKSCGKCPRRATCACPGGCGCPPARRT